jgi:hypothetical protein
VVDKDSSRKMVYYHEGTDMAFLAPLLGAILPSLIGGLAGAGNTRPPSLAPGQQDALNNLLGQLQGTSQGQFNFNTPVQPNPMQQALMYGQIAQSRTGADNALTHALTSRGLGRSGILGAGLMQNQNTAQLAQNQGNMGLIEQALQQRQLSIQDILGLIQTPNFPGQSGFSGFMNGLAPVAAYSIQNMMNSRNANPGAANPFSNPGITTGPMPPTGFSNANQGGTYF